MFWKKHKPVDCPISILFAILDDNLRDGLCTDIVFQARGKKHRFGAWGDQGETSKNVVYYLDKQEYGSRRELEERAMLDGGRLIDYEEFVTVTECDGCYPESTPLLKSIMDGATCL